MLRFNEPVRPTVVQAAARGRWRERRARRPDRPPTPSSTSPPAGLPDGTYVLSYRVTSADGHPVVGSFVFAIGARERRSAGLAAAGIADDLWPAAGVVARALWYGSLLLAAGLALFLALLPCPAGSATLRRRSAGSR